MRIFIYLFITKIVHEVQQEKLKYTKETKQYTVLGYQSLSTNAINSSGNLISIKQVSAQIRIVSKEQTPGWSAGVARDVAHHA